MTNYVTFNQLNEALARQTIMIVDLIDERMDVKFAKQRSEILAEVDKKLVRQLAEVERRMDAQTDDICSQIVDAVSLIDKKINNHEVRISKLEDIADL